MSSRLQKAELFANPRRSMIRTIDELAHGKRRWEVFSDFVECSALSIANSMTVIASPEHEKRETRYRQIVESYTEEQRPKLALLFALLVESLEQRTHDALGSLFMELDLGSHWHGQFFSPYELCRMMGAMTLDAEQMRQEIETGKGYVTLQEPAAGAGAMVLAFADAMREAGINYQRHLHVTAIDIDPLCVRMAYVQLSLLHIPAVVVHGNTLTLEQWGCWYTPAHVMGLWSARLRRTSDHTAQSSARDDTTAHLSEPADIRAAVPSVTVDIATTQDADTARRQSDTADRDSDGAQLALFG